VAPTHAALHAGEVARGEPRTGVEDPEPPSELNAGELFAQACGTTDFDACRPLTPERLPLWERAIAANRAIFDETPASPAGLVAGVRAATGLDVVGAPAAAAELFRAVAEAYAGEAALAPLAAGAARGVDSERAEWEARVAVLAPLLEHAASADQSAGGLDRALEDWERIARSPYVRRELRAPALLAAMKLARTLDDAAARARLLALGQAMGAPLGTRVELDWLASTFSYSRWDARGADVGENQRLRSIAAPEIHAFYTRWRTITGAAPWVVEAAWAAHELAQAGHDADDRRWLDRVVAGWAAMHETPAEPALRDRARDHAALAALGPLAEALAREFEGWSSSCARLAPSAFVTEYDTKAALAAHWASRLERESEPFAGSPALAAWHAASARAFDELRACLATQAVATTTPPPWLRFHVERNEEEAGRLATSRWTLALAWGAMQPAGVRAQRRLTLLAAELGNLAVETTIRATLAEGHLRFDDELPAAGAIWLPRGMPVRSFDETGPWFAP
jgi:hypothetical protein